MKVVFCSNFMNHHQLPICKELYRLTDGNFYFIATSPVPSERIEMGYYDMNKEYPFIIRMYEENNKKIINGIIMDADVVIHGDAPNSLITNRINSNKLVFRYSERLFKNGYIRILSIKGMLKFIKMHLANNRNTFLLCASSFTSGDFALRGGYINRCYKWGYFPIVNKYNLDSLWHDKKNKKYISILWVGRLIKLKHPELVIDLADKLNKKGYKYHINIIGSGTEEQHIKELIKEKKLISKISMLGAMSPEDVRKYMEEAEIFLFTSDYHEGWGAVLNESMNSACAVVASNAIGSVDFLLKNNENGLIFKNNNKNDLYRKVCRLLDDDEFREKIGRNAYYSLINLWNPNKAAKRFLSVCDSLLNNKRVFYKEGPCSVAERKYAGVIFSK